MSDSAIVTEMDLVCAALRPAPFQAECHLQHQPAAWTQHRLWRSILVGQSSRRVYARRSGLHVTQPHHTTTVHTSHWTTPLQLTAI